MSYKHRQKNSGSNQKFSQVQQPSQHPPQQLPSSINLKPTDVTISQSLESVFPEKVSLFNQLKTKERELDLMINKKLLDIQDYQQAVASGLTDDVKDSDILRIFIYNTSENQEWQLAENVDPAQTLPPSWTLRIEGRLLNETEPVDSPARKKFSSFLSGISVELKAKDGKDEELVINPVNNGTNARIIEWHENSQVSEAERQRQQFDARRKSLPI
ncbi:unnamed protein product [Ambrosiozyma monospora]|uniref:Unnamed protein product n=1 Tax=Ambrosiozyma monospora TaxID=43982 RepID=A0ACB5TPI6_AMBMO|nr:unnamed protein product [Ambrosiozyma monospora]